MMHVGPISTKRVHRRAGTGPRGRLTRSYRPLSCRRSATTGTPEVKSSGFGYPFSFPSTFLFYNVLLTNSSAAPLRVTITMYV